MLLSRTDGVVDKTGAEGPQLHAAGYEECPGRLRGAACPFWISPESQEAVKQRGGGYFTCPVCRTSHDLLHELPWHGIESGYEDEWRAGGGTRIGLGMDQQAQIGEDLVEKLGTIPGYGPITWWHQGGATAASPLDGATQEWGVEVKTLGYDAMHHRFVPGRPQEKEDKNGQAKEMGKRGVLGILVLLDYRRSVADIYAKEFPLGGVVPPEGGHTTTGVASFRSNAGQHLVAEVPFRNPLMDPHDPSPTVEKDDIPF